MLLERVIKGYFLLQERYPMIGSMVFDEQIINCDEFTQRKLLHEANKCLDKLNAKPSMYYTEDDYMHMHVCDHLIEVISK